MEQPNFVRNGKIRLPIGFRFHPTDEELVVHYLKRKIFSLPLPASIIPELNVFQTLPWDLPGDLNERKYFFSKRNGNEKRYRRVDGFGFWKAIGKEKQIVASGGNKAVGIKSTLVFCEGNRHHVSRTRWIMHEYRLVGSETTPLQNSIMIMDDWVVYRVFQKKRKPKSLGVVSQQPNRKQAKKIEEMKPSCIVFKMENDFNSGPPQPSSSSGIIDFCPSYGSDQEESSASTSFASYC